MELTEGTLLQSGKYRIEKVLGRGGFGITYLAEQVKLGRKVAIKEFFIKQHCLREGNSSRMIISTPTCEAEVQRFMLKFQKEARIISQLEHPNIIEVHDIFEENNTVYYVMEYIDGDSLFGILKKEGVLSEEASLQYIKSVASATKYMHSKKINHLDIKPSNIMVRRDDHKIILIDFGLSKQYDAIGEQTSITPLGTSPGYAPIEQYENGGISSFSPQSDIYSLGATLYALVVGSAPPDSHSILNKGLPELPSHISEETRTAISHAMQAKKADRPATLDEFLSLLPAKSSYSDEDSQIVGSNYSSKGKKSNKYIYIYVAIISITCLFTISYFITHPINSTDKDNDSIQSFHTSTDEVNEVKSVSTGYEDIKNVERTKETNHQKTDVTEQSSKTGANEPKQRDIPAKDANQTSSNSSYVSNMQVQNGTYTGETRNGRPHGKGKLTFNADAVISSYDVNGTCAQAGESIEGNFENGVFYRGIYHSSLGDKKLNFGSHGY